MSRSFRKNPIHPVGGYSDKKDKQLANRILRRVSKQKTKINTDTYPLLREVSNIWNMNKDGKFRFNPKAYPELKRK